MGNFKKLLSSFTAAAMLAGSVFGAAYAADNNADETTVLSTNAAPDSAGSVAFTGTESLAVDLGNAAPFNNKGAFRKHHVNSPVSTTLGEFAEKYGKINISGVVVGLASDEKLSVQAQLIFGNESGAVDFTTNSAEISSNGAIKLEFDLPSEVPYPEDLTLLAVDFIYSGDKLPADASAGIYAEKAVINITGTQTLEVGYTNEVPLDDFANVIGAGRTDDRGITYVEQNTAFQKDETVKSFFEKYNAIKVTFNAKGKFTDANKVGLSFKGHQKGSVLHLTSASYEVAEGENSITFKFETDKLLGVDGTLPLDTVFFAFYTEPRIVENSPVTISPVRIVVNDDGEIDVKMTQGRIPKDDINDIIIGENKDKDIIIKPGDGVEIKFEKGTMSPVEDDIDFKTEIHPIDKDAIDPVMTFDIPRSAVAKIDYSHSGKLPGMAEISLPVGKDHANMMLYYYELIDGKKLKFVCEALVDAYGVAKVKQDHCSSYVLLSEKVSENAPATGTDDMTSAILATSALGAAAAVFAVISRKKRKA